LSIIYSVLGGDNFESISRKKYGTEAEAERIAESNAGAALPLAAGTTLTIPTLPQAPRNAPQSAASATEDEVAVLINGNRFRFWDEIRIIRSIDAMDTVEFGAPFDSSAPGFRESFRPFAFKPVTITVGGVALFTGTMVSVAPVIENGQKIISVSGYSLPGVLNDCTPPASSFPLEFNEQGLREIASALAAPFGINVEFSADQGPVFERVAIEPGQKVLAFLTDLAKQRNLIIASSSVGDLIFLQSSEGGVSVANFEQGAAPLLSVAPFFSPQEYYSHITGIEPVVVGLEGSQYTVKNPRLLGVVRPLTFNAPDTLDADVIATVEAKAGRMFANMVSYSVRVATWRDPSGNLWQPNTSIKLLAPDAMVYSEYEFIIRSIQFEQDSTTQTATLNLVIPGSFSGKIPESLPWDD
jgi:prophage tail gpP-like protein